MKMLSFLECMNSTYGGPAFSLPSLLHHLEKTILFKVQLFRLKRRMKFMKIMLLNVWE